MKLTRLDILQFDALITQIKSKVAASEIKPFNYAFLKNTLKFRKYVKERNAFEKLMYDDWAKEKTPEDAKNFEQFYEFLNEQNEWKQFLAEEIEFEFYTIKLSDLKDQEYSLEVADALLETIIIDE